MKRWNKGKRALHNHGCLPLLTHSPSPIRLFLIVLSLWCFIDAGGKPVAELRDACRRSKILSDRGYKTDSLAVLYEAALDAEANPNLPPDEIREWAEFLFETGEQYKVYAGGGAAGNVQPGYPDKARKIFYKYLDWQQELNASQRAALKETDRVLIVTSFIGQLYLTEKDYDKTILEYERLADTHPAWLGLDAVETWRRALRYGSLANKVEHWQAFADTIKEVLDRPDPEGKLNVSDRAKLNSLLGVAGQHGVTLTLR